MMPMTAQNQDLVESHFAERPDDLPHHIHHSPGSHSDCAWPALHLDCGIAGPDGRQGEKWDFAVGLQIGAKVVAEPLGDEEVGTRREVHPVLLNSTDSQDEERLFLNERLQLFTGEVFKSML